MSTPVLLSITEGALVILDSTSDNKHDTHSPVHISGNTIAYDIS